MGVCNFKGPEKGNGGPCFLFLTVNEEKTETVGLRGVTPVLVVGGPPVVFSDFFVSQRVPLPQREKVTLEVGSE